MTKLMIFFFVTSLMTSFAFAGETSTECIMMREQNDRTNPKAGLEAASKLKPKSSKGNASAQ